MRIVFSVPSWPPARSFNGITTATSVVLPALREHGHQVSVLAMEGNGDGVNAHLVDRSKGLTRWWRACRLLSGWQGEGWELYDLPARRIAHTITSSRSLSGADIVEMEECFGWSGRVAELLSIPVVPRLLGPHFLVGAVASEQPFDRSCQERVRREGLAISGARFVTAPSRFVLDATRNHYDAPLSRAAVIPNAVNLCPLADVWSASTADFDEILFVGRFDRIKGADLVLEAFGQLAATRPNLKLTFAGPNDRPMTINGRSFRHDEFIKTFLSPEIARRVDFLGPVPHDQLNGLRVRAAVTVVTSRFETAGMVLTESLAAGAPTVLTRVGGMVEMVTHGENALIADCSAPAIAEQIAAILDRPELASRLGSAGVKHVKQRFSPAATAAQMIDAYQDVCEEIEHDRTRRGQR